MKKTIGIVFLTLAIVLAGLYSPWGQAKAKQFLLAKLKKVGIEVSVEQFSGTFPSRIRLKNLELKTDGLHLRAASADVDLAWIRILRGQIGFAKLEAEDISWTSSKQQKLAPLAAPIYVKHFNLKKVQSPELNLKGSLRLGRTKGSANISVQYDGLPELQLEAKGSIDSDGFARITFQTQMAKGRLDTDGQTGRFEVTADTWSARGRFGETVQFSLEGQVYGQFEIEKKGDLWQISASQFYYKNWSAENVELFLRPSLFSLSARGANFNGTIGGTWNQKGLEIETASGNYLNFPWSINEPFSATFKDRSFSPFRLNIGDGFMQIQQGQIDVQRVPLQIASENIRGTLDGQLKYKDGSGTFLGNFQETAIGTSGQFKGTFNPKQIEVSASASLGKQPLLSIELKAPVSNQKDPISGTLFFDGRIEDLFEFADFGVHRLEGKAKCDLVIQGSLAQPRLFGLASLQDGLYQNDYTGTELRSIQAEFNAKGDTIALSSFQAEGITAKGNIDLKKNFPYSIDAQMSDFTCASVDLLYAKAKGNLKIQGDLTAGLATGQIELIQADLSIPDHIPQPMPELQVVYKNRTRPIDSSQTTRSTYPLLLDLRVLATDNVQITGRGLNSTWKGDFYLSGPFTSFAAKGNLELIEGEFTFSSRRFVLENGKISLSGQQHEMPFIDLTAKTELKGIFVMANLKGPLNNPQLTFQSTPPLPLSSIMSYLLFGQDLSEISGFQALQLASSIASLLGQGPDVMESTRRSLGVDRLRIISSERPGQEGERVALEVGKYVSEGVLVSFSQGAEEDSTNISVEVELKGGFVFQVETLQEQEQGRFTLKWQINY